MSNGVFLSYRREASWTLVQLLYEHLTERGIDAFYDVESIRAGEFERIIIGQVRARPYFVLVLTPGTLDRCVSDGDWVRREIEEAVSSRRVILPVYTPNFDFGDFDRFLPSALAAKVGGYNAVELPHRYFKYAVGELVNEYLLPVEIPTVDVSEVDAVAVGNMKRVADETGPVTSGRVMAQERFESGLAKHSAGDVDAAIADYDEAIRVDPTARGAFLNRGIAKYTQGDLDGAIVDYDEAIRLDPTLSMAFNNRGVVRLDRGDVDGAMADFEEVIRLDPTFSMAFNNRGRARAARGDVDGAMVDYEAAIRLNPSSVTALVNRAAVKQDRGDAVGAITDLHEAIRHIPTSAETRFNPGLAANAFFSRGVMNEEIGEVDKAIADYDEAIRRNSNFADAFANRGNSKQAKGDLDGALADYDEAIRLNPTDGVALRGRGITKFTQGDWGGAIADYDQAIRLDSDPIDTFLRGCAKHEAGDLDGAIADYHDAIQRDGTVADFYFCRGRAFEAQKQTAKAIADYQRGAELAPGDVRFDKALRRLGVKGWRSWLRPSTETRVL